MRRISLLALVLLFAASVLGCNGGGSQTSEEAKTADDPVDEFAEALGLEISEVWDDSEEISEAEKAELETTEEGEFTTRGIRGFVIVWQMKHPALHISRGGKGRNYLGAVPAGVPVALYVGDWSGDTKLWASTVWLGRPSGVVYRRTVTGTHNTYRWNIR